MPTPGYYKTDPRALTLRELIRWYGLRRLPRMYAATRSQAPVVGAWMPALWSDLECSAEELSKRFWEATVSHRESFKQLGFSQCGFGNLKPHMILNPAHRDQGKITYLEASRSCVGGLIYSRNQAPAHRDIEQVTLWFTSVFQDAVVSCSNNKYPFLAIPGDKGVRVSSDDPAVIHDKFLHVVRQRAGIPRAFPDHASLRDWFDGHQIKTFENRVRRGLFVRMNDEEVAEARRKVNQTRQ